jgi:adenine-specific DNA glycosylase
MPVGALTRVGAIEHVLSHRKLTVDVLRAELVGPIGLKDVPEDAGYDDVRVVAEREIEDLGFSTLARKILVAARR